MKQKFDISTLSLHADRESSDDVSVPIHVSTTYRYPKNYNQQKAIEKGYLQSEPIEIEQGHFYSRMTVETRTRLEQVLGSFENSIAVTYSSGLAAIYAMLITIQPKVIIINKENSNGIRGVLWNSWSSRVVLSK